MSPRIARLFEPLLRLLLPGSGRRRLDRRTAAAQAGRDGPIASYADEPTVRQADFCLLRGEDNALVRPYVGAHAIDTWPSVNPHGLADAA